MYKKQMGLQKLLCFLAIGISAAIFVYSLGIMTDLYDTLYSTMRNVNDHSQTDVPGSIVYYDMQGFNKSFVIAAIVLILLSVLLFITNTHVRRKYYIGNYAASALFAIGAIGVAAWGHVNIEAFKRQFLQVDFEALKEHSEMWGTAYTESTFWFDVHYLLFGLLIAAAVLLIVNMIWKMNLMKQETALLSKGAN